MSFILRAAFWLTVLAFLLPVAGYESTPQPVGPAGFTHAAYTGAQPAPATPGDIGAGEALAIAARSAQDVMGFCGRNPDICDKGQAIVSHVMRQTVYYGGQAFVWLSEKAREQQDDNPADTATHAAIRPVNLPGDVPGYGAGA
ncbi:MAG: DUF5330 domain-containing protein [Parvibaculum sp.]|nr:DUF5330 domain-containing protein [Parvibaculum sp.]